MARTSAEASPAGVKFGPVLTNDELEAFSDAVRGTLERRWPSATAAADPAAGGEQLRALWSDAVEAGWTGLAQDQAPDALLAAMRELGRLACPLPIADVYVSVDVLEGCAQWTEAIVSGRVRPVVAWQRQDETTAFLEAAEIATHVFMLPDDPEAETVTLHEIEAVRPTPGLAVPSWSEVRLGNMVLEHRPDGDAPDRIEHARLLLRLALTTRAVAAAERAHELALTHAGERVQFERPIGSFQAVAHRCVDAAVELAAARALADDALRLLAGKDPHWRLAAALAVDHGLTQAPRVQLASHHTLAAIGYFDEHEAPWLFRRVHADVSRAVSVPTTSGDPVDLMLRSGSGLPPIRFGDRAEAFRAEIRSFLTDDMPDEAGVGGLTRDDPEFVRALAERGYLTMAWPAAHGGRDADVAEQTVLDEELGYHHAPCAFSRAAATMLGPAIIRFGTPQQQERFLPRIAEGRMRFYLGYSEPEVGSDLASLQTRAVLDGEEWVINGRKMWGTGAHEADYVWLAARTDPEADRPQQGISVFLFPTGLPGWEMQPHTALSGEISCSTFFDDVRVPQDALVGQVNEGWTVVTHALAAERIVMAGHAAALHRQLDEMLATARVDPDTTLGPRGSAHRQRVSELAARLQGARLLLHRGIAAAAEGGGGWLEAPMAKLLTGELAESLGEATLEILGPAAALGAGVPGAPGGGAFEYGLRLSIMYVIGGGTADIQRNLIARALGLPSPKR